MKYNPIGIVLTLLAIILIIGYVLFRFYPLVSGPSLSIISPKSDLITSEDSVTIGIEHDRLTNLSIQGAVQDINDSGASEYLYYLSDGANTIKIKGCDQYQTCRIYELFVFKRSG